MAKKDERDIILDKDALINKNIFLKEYTNSEASYNEFINTIEEQFFTDKDKRLIITENLIGKVFDSVSLPADPLEGSSLKKSKEAVNALYSRTPPSADAEPIPRAAEPIPPAAAAAANKLTWAKDTNNQNDVIILFKHYINVEYNTLKNVYNNFKKIKKENGDFKLDIPANQTKILAISQSDYDKLKTPPEKTEKQFQSFIDNFEDFVKVVVEGKGKGKGEGDAAEAYIVIDKTKFTPDIFYARIIGGYSDFSSQIARELDKYKQRYLSGFIKTKQSLEDLVERSNPLRVNYYKTYNATEYTRETIKAIKKALRQMEAKMKKETDDKKLLLLNVIRAFQLSPDDNYTVNRLNSFMKGENSNIEITLKSQVGGAGDDKIIPDYLQTLRDWLKGYMSNDDYNKLTAYISNPSDVHLEELRNLSPSYREQKIQDFQNMANSIRDAMTLIVANIDKTFNEIKITEPKAETIESEIVKVMQILVDKLKGTLQTATEPKEQSLELHIKESIDNLVVQLTKLIKKIEPVAGLTTDTTADTVLSQDIIQTMGLLTDTLKDILGIIEKVSEEADINTDIKDTLQQLTIHFNTAVQNIVDNNFKDLVANVQAGIDLLKTTEITETLSNFANQLDKLLQSTLVGSVEFLVHLDIVEVLERLYEYISKIDKSEVDKYEADKEETLKQILKKVKETALSKPFDATKISEILGKQTSAIAGLSAILTAIQTKLTPEPTVMVELAEAAGPAAAAATGPEGAAEAAGPAAAATGPEGAAEGDGVAPPAAGPERAEAAVAAVTRPEAVLLQEQGEPFLPGPPTQRAELQSPGPSRSPSRQASLREDGELSAKPLELEEAAAPPATWRDNPLGLLPETPETPGTPGTLAMRPMLPAVPPPTKQAWGSRPHSAEPGARSLEPVGVVAASAEPVKWALRPEDIKPEDIKPEDIQNDVDIIKSILDKRTGNIDNFHEIINLSAGTTLLGKYIIGAFIIANVAESSESPDKDMYKLTSGIKLFKERLLLLASITSEKFNSEIQKFKKTILPYLNTAEYTILNNRIVINIDEISTNLKKIFPSFTNKDSTWRQLLENILNDTPLTSGVAGRRRHSLPGGNILTDDLDSMDGGAPITTPTGQALTPEKLKEMKEKISIFAKSINGLKENVKNIQSKFESYDAAVPIKQFKEINLDETELKVLNTFFSTIYPKIEAYSNIKTNRGEEKDYQTLGYPQLYINGNNENDVIQYIINNILGVGTRGSTSTSPLQKAALAARAAVLAAEAAAKAAEAGAAAAAGAAKAKAELETKITLLKESIYNYLKQKVDKQIDETIIELNIPKKDANTLLINILNKIPGDQTDYLADKAALTLYPERVVTKYDKFEKRNTIYTNDEYIALTEYFKKNGDVLKKDITAEADKIKATLQQNYNDIFTLLKPFESKQWFKDFKQNLLNLVENNKPDTPGITNTINIIVRDIVQDIDTLSSRIQQKAQIAEKMTKEELERAKLEQKKREYEAQKGFEVERAQAERAKAQAEIQKVEAAKQELATKQAEIKAKQGELDAAAAAAEKEAEAAEAAAEKPDKTQQAEATAKALALRNVAAARAAEADAYRNALAKRGGANSESRKTINKSFEDINNKIGKVVEEVTKVEKKITNISDPATSLALSGDRSIFNALYNKYLESKQRGDVGGDMRATEELMESLEANQLVPRTVLAINMRDKIIFIFATLFIRLFSLSVIEFMIEKGAIKNSNFAILGYLGLFTLVFIAFTLLVNLDMYRLRIVFNYINFHANAANVYTYLALLWVFGGVIYYVTYYLNKDAPLLNTTDETKVRLIYRIQVISLIIWLFLVLMVSIL